MLITSAAIPRWPSGTDSAGRSPSDVPIGNRLRIGPKPFLFDRDGTLIENVPYLTDPGRVQPVPGAGQTLAALRRNGIAVGVISNQSGVAEA